MCLSLAPEDKVPHWKQAKWTCRDQRLGTASDSDCGDRLSEPVAVEGELLGAEEGGAATWTGLEQPGFAVFQVRVCPWLQWEAV